MLTLALKHRISMNEDALTACLLDALRYSSVSIAQDVLGIARPWAFGRSLPEFDSIKVEGWPTVGGREPDARILLFRGDQLVCRLLIEAKLGATKTGEGVVDHDKRTGDQLAYYATSESNAHPGDRVSILYLTHHAACPREELDRSAEIMRVKGQDDLADELFWLSWRDVEVRMNSNTNSLICQDVAEILRGVRMYRFQSFDLTPLHLTGAPEFYSGRSGADQYIDVQPVLGPFLGKIWSYGRAYFSTDSALPLGTAGNFYGGLR